MAHLVQTGHGPGEATLGVMPLFHTMGLRTLLASVLAAGTWVPQAKFDADEALDLIVRERVSALYLVPDDVLVADAGRVGSGRPRRCAISHTLAPR